MPIGPIERREAIKWLRGEGGVVIPDHVKGYLDEVQDLIHAMQINIGNLSEEFLDIALKGTQGEPRRKRNEIYIQRLRVAFPDALELITDEAAWDDWIENHDFTPDMFDLLPEEEPEVEG